MPASRPVEIADLRAGVVTAIRAQKRDPERVAVFIDDLFAFGLAAEIAVREGLRKGMELSVAEQQRLLDGEQLARARQAALDYVSHRPRTEAEVARRLARRGFSDEVAAQATGWLRDLRYLDDAEYARTFARERLERKGHGPARLRADLLRRGVAAETVQRVLDDIVEPETLREAAHELARKRWRQLSEERDLRKRRKRVSDFLARRGYGYELIRSAVEAVEQSDGEGAGQD